MPFYEPLDPNSDITTTKTALHEAIPITGSIVSGTYSDNNIKNYTHGQFQTVYDYPYLSSSANKLLDITIGYHASSPLSASTSVQNAKKINMYNEMSLVLLGVTGANNAVRQFEIDLSPDMTGSAKSGYFIALSRLLTKDEIRKGSFSITIGSGSYTNPFAGVSTANNRTFSDVSASLNGTQVGTCLGGEYGLLYDTTASITTPAFGIIYYQAGIIFLTSSIFDQSAGGGLNQFWGMGYPGVATMGVTGAFTGSSITSSCDALRHRIYNMSFNNTTDINSTIYFCRAATNKFNYSSNPTYVSSSQIVVKSVASDPPVSYITTVGLYNSANELLATAKLSEPLKKDPNNELVLRVRLDY
tara:strand:- start:1740 stop:2813 length:1074 start_codon:yes stop_codon:yes gene_type:complete